jgi:hypothetical protein
LRVVVPEATLMVLWSSVEEINLTGTLALAASNCEAGRKPEPRTSSEKLDPGADCVTDPEDRTGNTFSTWTLSEEETTGFATVAAAIVTEWPGMIVEEGEYLPEADIRPIEALPPVIVLTDHTTPDAALYCALLPSLTWEGPVTVTAFTGVGIGADVDAGFGKLCGRVLLQPASRNTSKAGNLDLMICEGERWDWLTSSP